jgi:signal transduction histidine kinase/CheY-like chemotaxis protein
MGGMGSEIAVDRTRGGVEASPPTRIYLLAGLLYPVWFLFTPAGANDSWLVWWIVAGIWIAIVAAGQGAAQLERHLAEVLPLCTWLVTGHLFALAAQNAMHPFYAVGSAMAVLAAIAVIRSRRGLLAYSGFVVLLAGGLFVRQPDRLALAYWGGLLPLLVLAYYRLAAQEAAGRLAAEYRDRLESQVAERTQALRASNESLRRAMEERERLEGELRISQQMEVVGRLAAAVSHEFNNLLCTIGVYAELLQDQLPASSELRREVAQIQNANRQATAISRQLLAISRPGQVRFESVDLNAVVERMRPALRGMLGPEVTLEIALAREPCLLWANPDTMEQILVNLVLNARDAMPRGGRLSIATASNDESVVLTVADTGDGMDAETRERAFEPFYTTKATGTGLGLAIVHTLVTQAKGRVRIESERGRGTRFELSWPPALPEAGSLLARTEVPPPEAGCETILLVEDQEELRAGLGRILVGAGYRVLEASDGEEALEVVTKRGEEVQLVVSDVVMPRMGGFELAEGLSARRPGVPILFVSGQLRHPSVRGRELPPGAAVLEKPFSAGDLRRQVRQLLDARAAHASG